MLKTDVSRSKVAVELHGILREALRTPQRVCRKSKDRGSELYQFAISFRWRVRGRLSTEGQSTGCDGHCAGGTSCPRRRPGICASPLPGNQNRDAVPACHGKLDPV